MKINKLSTSQQRQLLKNSDWKTFINQFNKVHNHHLNSSVGIVQIKTNDKKKTNKQKS
jgi:hypothetical protein